MGIESQMKALMLKQNEKKEKQKRTRSQSPSLSSDPNRRFLKQMVMNFFKSDTSLIKYERSEIVKLLDQLLVAVRSEPVLLELEPPIFVVGDIHGHLTDLRRIFHSCGFPSTKKFLFLGDYVDRGEHSIEVVCSLAAWKLLWPQNVFLLRGNHELAHINKDYGFLVEVQDKIVDPKDSDAVYAKFNEVFSNFPLAAVIAGKLLCMHGGLSPRLNSLNDVRALQRPIVQPTAGSLAQDLLWADPHCGIDGFKPNSVRFCSVSFGEAEVRERLRRLGISKVVRAHQVCMNGWDCFASGAVITIFSAVNYQEEGNCGAVMEVKKNLGLSFVVFRPANFDGKSCHQQPEPPTVDASASKKKGASPSTSDENLRKK